MNRRLVKKNDTTTNNKPHTSRCLATLLVVVGRLEQGGAQRTELRGGELGDSVLGRGLVEVAVVHLALEVDLILLHELAEVERDLLGGAGADVGRHVGQVIGAVPPHPCDEPLLLLGSPRRHVGPHRPHHLDLADAAGRGSLRSSWSGLGLGVGDGGKEDQVLVEPLLVINTLSQLSN